MAKELEALPAGSYAEAQQAYQERDPLCSPSGGIRTYLANNWEEF